jgi:hypothetical protein
VFGSCIPTCHYPAVYFIEDLKFASGLPCPLRFCEIGRKRYYTFIASPKIPWDRLWSRDDGPVCPSANVIILAKTTSAKINRPSRSRDSLAIEPQVLRDKAGGAVMPAT